MWLIGKKFEKTIGVSFNTINHLCWNILHNQSFSFPCRYFSSLTWYKMYMLFVALESYFPHAVAEQLRAWPITAPFGLWLQVSAFIWCPELTSKDVAAWRVAWGRGSCFFSVQLRAETLRIWCNEIYKPAWEGSLFTEEKHGFCQPSQPALSPSKTNICDSFGSMRVACRLLNGQCKMSGGC